MADEPKTPAPGAEPPAAGVKQPENPAPKTPDEIWASLSPEQQAAVYQTPRFKELTEAKQRLKALEEKQAQSEEARLKEQNEYKTLWEKEKAEKEALRGELSNSAKRRAIIDEAAKQGAADSILVEKLIDLDKIEVDDKGNATNVADLVKQVLTERPILRGTEQPRPNLGNGANPQQDPGGKTIWKQSELRAKMRDHKWYKENEAEIAAATKEGRIIPE